MPYTQKDEVLAAAKKDKRITTEDYLKLEKHFNTTQTTNNNLNNNLGYGVTEKITIV